MADPMKIRANLVGDTTEVKVLMNHEMETGQRKDAQGKTIPAWFIQSVSATCNDKTVLSAQWGPAVSKNPFLSFKFKGGAKGDKVVIYYPSANRDPEHFRDPEVFDPRRSPNDHVTFGGKPSVTIPAGAPAISDPVDIKVAPLAQLSVSLFFPEVAPGNFFLQVFIG